MKILKIFFLIFFVFQFVSAGVLPGTGSVISDFQDLKEGTQKELENVDDQSSAKVKANLEAAIEILETARQSGGIGRTRKTLKASINHLKLLARRTDFLSPNKIKRINAAFQLAEDRLRAYLVKHGV